MKKIIEKTVLNILTTKCYDDETKKYYKFKDRQLGVLMNMILYKPYSEDLYEITDIEADIQDSSIKTTPNPFKHK